jgi:hypothetical protein
MALGPSNQRDAQVGASRLMAASTVAVMNTDGDDTRVTADLQVNLLVLDRLKYALVSSSQG